MRGEHRQRAAGRVDAGVQRDPALADVGGGQRELVVRADRPAAEDGVADERVVAIAVVTCRRLPPAPLHAEPAGEVRGQVLTPGVPDFLQPAHVGADLGQRGGDRLVAALPGAVTPPQIPGQDPHRPSPASSPCPLAHGMRTRPIIPGAGRGRGPGWGWGPGAGYRSAGAGSRRSR